MGYDLFNRYGIIHKFKVQPAVLETFLTRIEEGYCRYSNPYHNNLHAADVTQTVHYVLCQTGLMVSSNTDFCGGSRYLLKSIQEI